MSHNTIFQIATEPVSTNNHITEADFYEHWFIGSIADSVSDDIDRNEEIFNLRKWLEKEQIAVFDEYDTFTILPDGKKKYFKNAHKKFIDAAKKAITVSIELFAEESVCAELVYQISNSYCEKFEPYVSSDEFDTIPFDKFIRNAEYGKRYYIGGVLNYHW